MTDTDIAWLAGLLEGEGSFGIDARSAKRYKVSTSPGSPFVKISMVDKDIMERVATMVNKKVFSPNRAPITGKKVYTAHIGDRPTLTTLLPKLFPYLGCRRQAQVQICLEALEDHNNWLAKGGLSEMAKEGPKSKKRG